MNYSVTPQSGNFYTHLWDISSTREFEGGFLFDKSNIPSDTEKLPRGVFLAINQTERTAKLIKTATLYEAITAESTVVKIKKGAYLVNGDILGIGTVSVSVAGLDTSNVSYDSFTITANALGALSSGAILQTYDEAGSNKNVVNPDGFNYAEVKIDLDPTCSVIYEARGIYTDRLPQAATTAIKSALKFCQFLS